MAGGILQCLAIWPGPLQRIALSLQPGFTAGKLLTSS